MDIRAIEWEEALPVRHEVLWPNKAVLFCKVDGDEIANHYGVYIEEKLVSVASVYIEDNMARLRKFATLVEFQGDGLGTTLITYIINVLKSVGIEYFWCDARTTAIGFYRKFNMVPQGAEFNKSGVLYVKMKVQLLQL
ncbi:MAG: GNAT family N-acetyltransferase [Alteromonadaceae bacterium]|nr:GNAT family N-acetyltransferase [Alteromonadaceae bacterium]